LTRYLNVVTGSPLVMVLRGGRVLNFTPLTAGPE
jgi:hypothetical protein